MQVLDGHSGKPVSTEMVRVDCLTGKDECPGFREFSGLAQSPDGRGEVRLRVPLSATTLIVGSNYDEYEDCAGWSVGDGWYGVDALRSTGTLGKNSCGHPSAKTLKRWQPQPGRLVVFLHRKPWWVRMLPYC